MVDSNEYNILLYGETGAGKSTFLNALDSYLKYSTLETGLHSKVCSRIALKFVWENDDYERVDVEFGCDRNENLNTDGESSTQNLMIHNYAYRGKTFRFIDTPGFNDTRSYEIDVENRKKIVKFLKRFPYLHAVCFVMKHDENRETLKFRYNIKNILSLFHKNLCTNLIFLFTHSAATDLKPNTTNVILENVLNQIRAENNCVIPFNKANSFYIDNDCFRYLIAVKLGKDTLDSTDIYSEYWSKSRGECIRLIEHVQTLEPVLVDDILRIEKSILRIQDFYRDMQVNTEKLEEYLALINEKENRIKISEKNIERLQSRLYDVAILVREGPWHVLCTNANCAKGDIYGRDGKACCPNCRALSISWCWTIDPMWSKCTICGCSKTHHELLQIPNFEEKTKRKNLKVAAQIETEEEQRAGYNDEKLKLMVTRGKLIGEEARIRHDMLEEISYLKRDGLHVFNKETIELFDIEISVCRDEERTNRLRNYLKRYQELYDLYQNSKNNNE